jgi:hypothetical protein
MPCGIVIPTDMEEPMYVADFSDYRDYQKVIGGNFEPVDLTEPTEATVYVDEEGLLKSLPLNVRATLMVMVHNPAFLYHGANLLGTAVIVGAPDDEGETKDVPSEFVELLLHTTSYKIEVQTSDDKETWNGNQRRFERIEEAYDHAINLAYKWFAVERVRVVAA